MINFDLFLLILRGSTSNFNLRKINFSHSPVVIFFSTFPGSQHSGAYEEDFNASSNDLDSNQQESTHENNNESIEDEDDVDGVDARCVVCERQCGDIDQ